MENSEILGLDVGEKRSGIARASLQARLAEPLMSVKTAEFFDCLKKLLGEHQVSAIVVGLPRNLQGDDTTQTQWVRGWVAEAKKNIDIDLFWQDEALTSDKAKLALQAGKTGHDIDARAAAIILQDFLDTPEEERVRC